MVAVLGIHLHGADVKRFALFAGSEYYPRGGWEDFIGDAETEADALEMAANKAADWWQIVDTWAARPSIVRCGRCGLYE